MRYLNLLIVLLLFELNALAQVANAEFTNVAKKYDKGNYESALESAESLIDNDKHRKKPEPYLWASMCYYQIYLSEDQKVIARVKSPLRNALKYAGKSLAKDNDDSVLQANQEYFNTMKQEGVKLASEQEAEGDFRKASYTLKQVMKLAPNDAFVQFAKGVVDIKMNAYYQAQTELSKALNILEQNYRNLEYTPDPISSPMLKPGILYYIDHLTENAYQDSANKVLMAARVFFPLDEEIKQRFQDAQ